MHVKRGLRRPFNRRQEREKGATLVLVTLLMVVLLGMAAISVDFAIASSDKAKAQNAADAAALAIARECAVQSANCSTAGGNAEASWAVGQNSPGKSATVSPAPAFANKQVTVRVQGVQQTQFARMLGNNSVSVGAEATASWDRAAVGGDPDIPMGIGFCDWNTRKGTIGTPGTLHWYKFSSLTNSGATCTGVPRFPGKQVKHPTNQMMWFTSGLLPGINAASCKFSPSLWDVYKDILDTGLFEIYSGCDAKFAQVKKGDIILMPIYGISNWKMPWIGTEFPNSVAIIGFAPFKVKDFKKNGIFNIQQSSDECRFPKTGDWLFGLGNCTQIQGQFVRTARPLEGWTYSNTFKGQPAEDLGAIKVTLTK